MGHSREGCFGADTARPGADGDVDEAEAAITRLADAPADDRLVIRKTGCCGCALCWPRLTVTRPPTATTATATARWPQTSGSRAI